MKIADWISAILPSGGDGSAAQAFSDWLEERDDPRCYLLRFVPRLLAETPPPQKEPSLPVRWWWEEQQSPYCRRSHTHYRDTRRDWPLIPAPAWPAPDNPRMPDYYKRCWKPYWPLYSLLKVALCRVEWMLRLLVASRPGHDHWQTNGWVREELTFSFLHDYTGREHCLWADTPHKEYDRTYLLPRSPKSCRNVVERLYVDCPIPSHHYDHRAETLRRRAIYHEYFLGLVNTFNATAPWEACKEVTSRWRFGPGDGKVVEKNTCREP